MQNDLKIAWMRGGPKALREECGVTLVELMIAAGVLAVAIVLLLGGLISIGETNAITENQTVASAYLESVVEETQALSYDQLLAYQPPAMTGLGASSTIQVQCMDSAGNPVMLPVDPASLGGALPNPTEVQITVVWNDVRGRVFTARTSTLCRRWRHVPFGRRHDLD